MAFLNYLPTSFNSSPIFVLFCFVLLREGLAVQSVLASKFIVKLSFVDHLPAMSARQGERVEGYLFSCYVVFCNAHVYSKANVHIPQLQYLAFSDCFQLFSLKKKNYWELYGVNKHPCLPLVEWLQDTVCSLEKLRRLLVNWAKLVAHFIMTSTGERQPVGCY